MVQSLLDRFREQKSATSDEVGDLEHEINRLRKMLAMDHLWEFTTAYLIELQAAVESVARAIKEERWARQGYNEFLGE